MIMIVDLCKGFAGDKVESGKSGEGETSISRRLGT